MPPRKRVRIGGQVVNHVNEPHAFTHTAATGGRLHRSVGISDFTQDDESASSSSGPQTPPEAEPMDLDYNYPYDREPDEENDLPVDDIVSVPAARKAAGLEVVEKNRSLNSVNMSNLSFAILI